MEASLIYVEARGWDTAQISEEMEESEDMKRMQLLIAGRKRHDERHELINDARWHARTLLQKADLWSAVCSFALLLIQEQKFQWYSLPENYKQIIENLIARGMKNSQTQFP